MPLECHSTGATAGSSVTIIEFFAEALGGKGAKVQTLNTNLSILKH